ncbi:amidohydrolase [Sphingobacterium psychroaquaticum]|uniref:amidohydrolase family protein n=1 Tax=Sphingobacterium psychroaquaticum TaxID=561061 RepID=UPI00106B4BE0|nr:amidohydrolase family protein [Sphingobacterium psychroaquaticum]QBQ41813.1 amidohydrolase [Sphingobacterium psychroaquaticum]
MRIDAHQHFWIFDPVRDAWITEKMSAIRRNFLPTDLSFALKENRIDGVIAVQADQSTDETQFLVDLSTMYAMIKGVVGWVDLRSPQVAEQLAYFSQYKIIKGYRHIIEAEADADFLMQPSFLNGIKQLTEYNYTYDLLIAPRHYASTLACVEANPNQQFVLDHMAKPNIRDKAFDTWASFMEKLAAFPNVYCKVSGLAVEAQWPDWELDDFVPYIDHAVATFGKDRLMYGSDWPVSLVAASYAESIAIADHALKGFTPEEQFAFWGGNAAHFYKFKNS